MCSCCDQFPSCALTCLKFTKLYIRLHRRLKKTGEDVDFLEGSQVTNKGDNNADGNIQIFPPNALMD